jgi:TRAP-type C4-dicarboxylate transport system permease small subunit
MSACFFLSKLHSEEAKMKSFAAALERVQIFAGTIAISIFLITVVIQIAARFLKVPVMWAEDVSVYSFIWAVFMGAAAAVNHNQHFAFTTLGDKLTGKAKNIHSIVIALLMMVFTVAMTKYGMDVTLKFWNYQWVNLPNMKMGFVWMALPITGVTMTIYLFSSLLEQFYLLSKGGGNR